MYVSAQVTSNLMCKSKLSVRTRSSNKVLLKIMRPYTEKFKRSLVYTGPKNGMRCQKSSTTLKLKLLLNR